MSISDCISLTFSDGIARVEINRPKSLNALDLDILMSLRSAFIELGQLCRGDSAYQKCRSVIVSGAGEKAFVAGADIKLMMKASKSELQSFVALGQSVMREIENTPLPVIAMVDGFAIGGGLELALACDLIVASENAKLGLAEINLGLIPGFGGTQRLTGRCGVGVAKRIVFTGETVSAAEAYRLGIIDWLVAPEEIEETTLQLARSLGEKGPLALAAAKQTIDGFFGLQLIDGLSNEVSQFQKVFDTADAKEGLTAFVEKRKAEFKGR